MRQIGRWMFGFAALVAAGLAALSPASAQSWPNQRVTIVVPFGPGSVTDILARIFADEMGRRWNQQVAPCRCSSSRIRTCRPSR